MSFQVPEEITINTVIEIKGCFLATPAQARVEIDVGPVEKIDFAGAQLLIAFLGGDAEAPSPRLTGVNPAVAKAFARAGIPLPEAH